MSRKSGTMSTGGTTQRGRAGAVRAASRQPRTSRKVIALGNLKFPESLAARLFILAYDPQRGRLTARSKLGKVLRAAVLVDTRDTLRASRLVSRVDLRDASVVVLASTADLRTVVTKEQKARHKDRLAQLAVRVGPVVPALKRSLQQSQYSAGG